VPALAQLAAGLWRWTVAHPAWRPGAAKDSPADWPPEVGCVLCDTPESTVLIDPLLPPCDDRFLRVLDRHVRERQRPVTVLTTIGFHRRSRYFLAERYGASTSRARKSLPAGVDAHRIRGAGETMFWLTEHRALVAGDRVLGAPGGGLRLSPPSWLAYLPRPMTVAELAEALRPLLELPIERVLVSHGEPVLSGGRDALAEALRTATGGAPT
jgi:hypothetical protein